MLGDVARVELGAERYSHVARFNGKPATGIAVSLATGANALATSRAVEAKLAQLALSFPPGVETVVPFDTTPFVRSRDPGRDRDAARGRRARVPGDVPVPAEPARNPDPDDRGAGGPARHVLGAGDARLLGQHVDDVRDGARDRAARGRRDRRGRERRAHHARGGTLARSMPRESRWTRSPARWSASAWCSRRCSCRWHSSVDRRASSTASSRRPSSRAMALSVAVAIILTPALCATMLKPVPSGGHLGHARFLRLVQWTLRPRQHALPGLSAPHARPARRVTSPAFAAMVAIMAVLFLRLPTAFLPQEDQGWLMAQIMAPPGATQERTMQSIYAVERHFLEDEKDTVRSVFTVQGFSFSGSGQNAGIAWVNLKDWSERKSKELGVDAVARPRDDEPDADQGCDGVRLRPSSAARTRHLQGLRVQPQGRGRPGPRCARCGPQPVPRRCDAGQAACERATERAGRRTAVPHRRGQQEGRGARRLDRRHQRHARHRLGRPVHRRLRRPRARKARVRAVRRAVSHGARGLQPLEVRNRRARWCLSRRSRAGAGTTAHRDSSATTAPRRSRSTASRRRA